MIFEKDEKEEDCKWRCFFQPGTVCLQHASSKSVANNRRESCQLALVDSQWVGVNASSTHLYLAQLTWMSMHVVETSPSAAAVSLLDELPDSAVSSAASAGASAEEACSVLMGASCLGLPLLPLRASGTDLRVGPTCTDSRKLSDWDLRPADATAAQP